MIKKRNTKHIALGALVLFFAGVIAAPYLINTAQAQEWTLPQLEQLNEGAVEGNYTLTLSPSQGGQVFGRGSFEEGEELTIVAIPQQNFHFYRWIHNGTGHLLNPTEETTTFTMPARDVSIQAIFRQGAEPPTTPDPSEEVQVIITSTSGGTATGGGTHRTGEEILISATPLEGYTFIGWEVQQGPNVGAVLSSNLQFLFTVPGQNTVIQARFMPNTDSATAYHNVSFTSVSNVSFLGAGTFSEGERVTIEAVVGEQLEFVRWVTTQPVTFANPSSTRTSFTMPTQNVQLTAEVRPRQSPTTTHRLSVNASQGGRIINNPSGQHESQARVELLAEPNSGWEFVNWTHNGGGQFGTPNQVSSLFTMPNHNVTVTANFREIDDGTLSSPTGPHRQLTVQANPVGGGSVTGTGQYRENESVNITANPQPGHRFVEWRVTQGNIEIANTQSSSTQITMGNQAATIQAIFEQSQNTVTTGFAQGGTTQGGGMRSTGSTVSITATPQSGWRFDRWVGEVDFANATSATTTFTMPENDVTVTPVFVQELTSTLPQPQPPQSQPPEPLPIPNPQQTPQPLPAPGLSTPQPAEPAPQPTPQPAPPAEPNTPTQNTNQSGITLDVTSDPISSTLIGAGGTTVIAVVSLILKKKVW